MHDTLQALLDELAAFGAANDAGQADRTVRMRNVTPETGELLGLLVRASRARRILEVGTSNGYSTLWLADAATETDGHVTTLEFLASKAELAAANFARAGLTPRITLHQGDATPWLAAAPDHAFDLIFLDADREFYHAWWPDLQRILAPGGTVVLDNIVSHAAELRDFVDRISATPGYRSVELPLGMGVLLAVSALA